MSNAFVHLRIHSEYSLVDSLVSISGLLKNVAKMEMPAVALTDQCNFYALVKFYKDAIALGVKPIIGSDFFLLHDDGDISCFTLLAMNDTGYKNITEIISLAYLEGQELGVAYVKWEWLEKYNEGIIVLSGAKFGNIGKALLNEHRDLAEEWLVRWMQVFNQRFYLELQRTGRYGDETYLHEVLDLAQKYQCPVVATNDVRFISEDDFEAHEARVCIHDGAVLGDPKRLRRYSEQQYLRSAEEMQALFADIPSAIVNTVEIAKRCNVQMRLGKPFLPACPVKDSEIEEKTLTENQRLGVHAQKGLIERLDYLNKQLPPDKQKDASIYQERLDFELGVIIEMGFAGYFLIVEEFIGWAKKNAVPVGPGRGSGAGSLVAYALKITDLDPLEYDLLFERFLNPERVSMPDFDVDFCMEKRGEVIRHVVKEYGNMAVSQIITFGTMAAKGVIRDVARVLGKSYGLADKLSKLIPFEVGITLEKAFEQEESVRDFIANDADANEIWEMSLKLQGTVRGVGKHAGGVVIAPTKITDFCPVYCVEDNERDADDLGLVSQFDKGDVEAAGLVKFDFLGLRTLTIIDWALKIIDKKRAATGELPIDILAIPLDDSPTYQLLQQAETTAVFQLESRGMKDLIKRLKPGNFEDLIALVALFRPGPLDSGMVDDFVNRKHGKAEVAYPDVKYQHEWLQPILKPTYGVIVYQEQVMQIAQVLAGYSLGGADLLRRAMGKKDAEGMAKQRNEFAKGAEEKGVNPELAMKIFDLVEKFAGYGFNKSHSAAYALVSYQTAWLKAHYPAPFMAAVMSSEMDDTDKIVTFIEECRRMKLPLINPDVNCGEYKFSVNDKEEIVYGLGAIKGLGAAPVASLIQARQSGGPFKSLFDFCARIDLRKVNKRALEALIKAGAFDTLGESRAMLLESLPEAVQAAEQQNDNADSGMDDLFGVVDTRADADVYLNFRHIPVWSIGERLAGEKETLGLFLTGHPIDAYDKELKTLGCTRLMHLQSAKKSTLVAGILVSVRYIKTKRGDNMAVLTLDDRTGRTDVTIFAKQLPDVASKLVKDALIFIRGEVEMDEYSNSLRMRCESVMTLADVRSQSNLALHIQLTSENWNKNRREQLKSVLKEGSEGCNIVVHYFSPQAECDLKFAQNWRVIPDDKNILYLKRVFGEDNVNFK